MKLFLRLLLGTVALLAALVAWAMLGNQPTPFPAGSLSAERLAPGPWTVGRFDETFMDRSRATQTNGDYAGEAQRRLPGTVWYPLELVGRPLLVFSHGFTSYRGNGRYLGEHLASYGFVVAAVDYPLTNWAAPGGPLVEDVVNQPGDISFLVDTLAGYSRIAGHALSGKIDATRVGVLGISLGGLTSTLAAFHPDLRDTRIAAALSIAGPTNLFTPRFFAEAEVPFLMLAGDQDALVPWGSNAQPVPGKVPGARLVTVRDGSHTGFSHGAAWLRMMKNTDAIGCYSVQRFVDEDDGEDWAGLLGEPEIGIDYGAENELCAVDPLPQTINVLRQQMIARVVARAFFESTLAPDDETRAAASRYLDEVIGSELADVNVSLGRARAPAGDAPR